VRHIAGLSEAPERAEGDRRLTYTGIAVFEARILDNIEPGESSLITPIVEAMLSQPGSVRGYAPPSLDWDDLGTLARWLRATVVDASTSDGFDLARITGHGSDRKFWRLSQGDWSAVAMMSPPEDNEFKRFVAIGTFLHEHNLGAAEFLSRADEARTVLMSDLGPDSLHSLAVGHLGDEQALRALYEPVVDHLLELQKATELAELECPLALDRCFDRDQLLWETSYFCQHFLQGHLGMSEEETHELAPEFEKLAKAVDKIPKVLMHRDFQSQNIHLQDGNVRLVDHQGMRRGPCTYDLASLIWDPYVKLPENLQRSLIDRFVADNDLVPAKEAFQWTALSGLQRLMQALGAYGYLGHVKQRQIFLQHIPSGVANLRALLPQLPKVSLPKLTALMNDISDNRERESND